MGKRTRRRGKNQVVVKKVRHPGTKAQPFLEPALEGANALLSVKVRRILGSSVTANKAATIRKLDNAVRAVAEAVKVRAKKLAPKVTRRLSNSINVRKERVLSYTVGTNVEYAIFVEKGTKPHIIEPKSKQALAFTTRRGRQRAGKRRRTRGRGGRGR